MNYKDLFHIAILLISSPARAWEEISLEDRRKSIYCFCLSYDWFMRVCRFHRLFDEDGMGRAAKLSICHDTMLCGGCILVWRILFGSPISSMGCVSACLCRTVIFLWRKQFAGYALVVVFMLRIVIGILPDFGIMALLLQFYIVYVVWEGSKKVMQIAEKDRLRFTILSSILLIACPVAIEWIFNKLTVVLN